MRRIMGLMIGIFAAVLISGCAVKKDKIDVPPEKQLTMWHWLSDRQDVLEKLSKKYYEKTGIYVKMELFSPSEAYKQKIMASAQTDTLPEIYGILGSKRDKANFIKSGHVMPLSAEMKKNDSEWKKQFFRQAINSVSFSEGNEFKVPAGIYEVPLDVVTIQFIYNKDIFKKAGIDPDNPPVTWEEFVKAGEKVKATGVDYLISGFGEPWLASCLASNFAWNIMGENKMLATYRGEVSYTDPDWIKVFSLFDQLAKKGLFASGIVILSNKEAELNFSLGRAALAFNGSWAVNVYDEMTKEAAKPLDYGVMLPPKVSNANPVGIWGGAGTRLVVNAKSSKKDLAVEFLKWLTMPEQQKEWAIETKNIPANKNCIDLVPDKVKGFLEAMKYAYHPDTFPVQEDPVVQEAFSKGLQAIIIQEKTPQQVAEELDKLKKKQMEKQK